MQNSNNNNVTYEARLCHVVKRDDFDGYGFNLHAEKGRPGQYIGKVDEGSPAESSGLKQGDRIIEVNGHNIGTDNHKKVVELIKAVPNETKLLVIDPKAEVKDGKIIKAPVPNITNGVHENNKSNDVNENIMQHDQHNNIDNNSVNKKKIAYDESNQQQSNDIEQITIETRATLNLKMTAAELRAQLAAKKKYDPKNDSLDLRKKYEMIQKM